MNTTSAITARIQQALREVSGYFAGLGHTPLSDIHIQAKKGSGGLYFFDDSDMELTHCTVDEWAALPDGDFYPSVADAVREAIRGLRPEMEVLNLQKPYSFVLVDSDRETVCELYLVDDDLFLISGELMEGLSEDLDRFWEELSKDM